MQRFLLHDRSGRIHRCSSGSPHLIATQQFSQPNIEVKGRESSSLRFRWKLMPEVLKTKKYRLIGKIQIQTTYLEGER
jgi:hypothetical protein